MRAHHPALAVALGAALLVAGCSDGAAEPTAEAPAPAAPTSAAPTSAAAPAASPTGATPTSSGSTGSGGATSSPSPGSPTAGSTAGSTAAGAPSADLTSLGLQDRHPNGSLLQVTSVSVERTGIVVGISVVNGHTDEITLNSWGLYLQDDAGNGYNFREPAQNGDLALAPGAELVGDLVFLGVLDPSATELTLKTNVPDADTTIDTSARTDQDASPSMLVTGIPLP